MSVRELSRNCLIQLKQNLISNNKFYHQSDLTDADFIIPDDVIYEIYADIDFVDDDFWDKK